MKLDSRKTKYKGRLFFYSLMILIIIGGYFFVFQKIYASTIYPRVHCCNNFTLSGLGPEEAEVLLKLFVEKIESEGYSFYAQTDLGDKHITIHPNLIALDDPDLSRSLVRFDVRATIEKAYSVGRGGSFIQRILKMLPILSKKQSLDFVIEIEEAEIEQILRNNFEELEKPLENARIELSDSTLNLIDEKPGFILDYQSAITQLKNNLKTFINNEIQLSTLFVNPEIKAEDSLPTFTTAQELFAFSPYFLSYQNKEWAIEADQIVQWFDLERDNLNQISLTLNQEKILTYLDIIAQEINIEPGEHILTVEGGRVTEFQLGGPGLTLSMQENVKIITDNILNKVKNIDLKVEKVEPASLPEDVDSLGIKEFVGQGVSNFAGSPENRRYNIAVGAQKLHGLLIPPDQEFSLVEALGDIDEEHGFLPEFVIKGDRTIPEYGGGLCQIATTAFRVAINTGLPITERRSHSYRVVYYEPAGMDATIYIPQPDLKFINDTDHHILFQTRIKGNELIFEFYGTSDGRIVQTSEPKVFNITDPGPVRYIESTELNLGQKKKVESSHFGADTEFKNIITFANGIIREDVWESHYRPWPEVWMIGKEIQQEGER